MVKHILSLVDRKKIKNYKIEALFHFQFYDYSNSSNTNTKSKCNSVSESV